MEERVPYKHKVVVRFCHLLYSLCYIILDLTRDEIH